MCKSHAVEIVNRGRGKEVLIPELQRMASCRSESLPAILILKMVYYSILSSSPSYHTFPSTSDIRWQPT